MASHPYTYSTMVLHSSDMVFYIFFGKYHHHDIFSKINDSNDSILTLKVWILRIAGARPSDSGHYQCQVAILIFEPPSLLSDKKHLTDI